MMTLKKDKIEKKCCIPDAIKEMVSNFAHSRQKGHFIKQLSKVLDLLIKDKKLSFITVKEKIGYMTKSTFLRYINTFRKIGLCRRKRDQQTNEICYYFIKNEDLETTLFFLKSDFHCPILFKKKHGLSIIEQNREYLNAIKDPKQKNNANIFDDIGYLYLLEMSGNIKIGASKDLNTRMKMLNYLLAEDINLCYSIRLKNPFKIEKILHNKYKDKRVKGEWFRLTKDDINEIKIYLDSINKLCGLVIIE